MSSTSKSETRPTIKPKNRDALLRAIKTEMARAGDQCDLNFIDVSGIKDFSQLFLNSTFNGDLSRWDVSNATTMYGTFANSAFNGDISKWNVSHVLTMQVMFENSAFAGDISQWDVSRVVCMRRMFSDNKFNGDLSKWNVVCVNDFSQMFCNGDFTGDISAWPIHPDAYLNTMFARKQTKIDKHACLFHWRLANLDPNNVSPTLQAFHAKHLPVVKAVVADPSAHADWLQKLWVQEKMQMSLHEKMVVDSELFGTDSKSFS